MRCGGEVIGTRRGGRYIYATMAIKLLLIRYSL